MELKDETLWRLSQTSNVARFVSFDSQMNLRYCNFSDSTSERSVDSLQLVIELLSLCDSVNIRTFLPGQASGNPFIYGISNANTVIEKISEFGKVGLFCLVNETISINDGGVSGVVDQGVVEFSPDDTPRAVEKPGICALPLDIATTVLQKVYGISQPIPFQLGQRVEFSLHPNRVGVRNEHVLVWESSPSQLPEQHNVVPSWPNNFSRHIGDKVFGLLIAQAVGLSVPFATVVGRRVAPFIFGQSTMTGETWIRTCPLVQEPGKYTTTSDWTDPFVLIQQEDPGHENIQSLIFQESVHSLYSGATLPTGNTPVIEGVFGKGDDFMSGNKSPEELPIAILNDVRTILQLAESRIGHPVRMEWVHDGKQVWVVQLHVISRERLVSQSGDFSQSLDWVDFDPESGIIELARVIELARKNGNGVRVIRAVGVTSHIGDLLRKSNIAHQFAAIHS